MPPVRSSITQPAGRPEASIACSAAISSASRQGTSVSSRLGITRSAASGSTTMFELDWSRKYCTTWDSLRSVKRSEMRASLPEVPWAQAVGTIARSSAPTAKSFIVSFMTLLPRPTWDCVASLTEPALEDHSAEQELDGAGPDRSDDQVLRERVALAQHHVVDQDGRGRVLPDHDALDLHRDLLELREILGLRVELPQLLHVRLAQRIGFGDREPALDRVERDLRRAVLAAVDVALHRLDELDQVFLRGTLVALGAREALAH